MFATIRRYAGLTEAITDALAARVGDMATVLESVPGTSASQLIRTRDGVILVTVGSDEASLIESGRRVRAWMDANVHGFLAADEADVWAGRVVLHAGASGSHQAPARRPDSTHHRGEHG